MSTTRRRAVLIAVVATIICILGWGTVQANAETKINLAKSDMMVQDVNDEYYYDGKPHGSDTYTIYMWERGDWTNITDSVTIEQKKHTDVGNWFVKVTAKKDSRYTGSKMVRAFTIFPKAVTSLKMSYSKKAKKTTVSFKMPMLKKGYYDYYFYSGREIYDPVSPTKSEKKRIIKHGTSKKRAWNSKEKVKITISKKLSKGTYHVFVVAKDSGYTNRTGEVKYNTDIGNHSVDKKLVVK